MYKVEVYSDPGNDRNNKVYDDTLRWNFSRRIPTRDLS